MNTNLVSKSKYFSIFLTMAAVFFLFQFSQIVRERGNHYDVNDHIMQELPSGEASWEKRKPVTDDYVLWCGSARGDMADTVSQWAIYNKKSLKLWDGSSTMTGSKKPEMILIDAANADLKKGVRFWSDMAGAGVPLVFCNLPEASVIREQKELAQLLGISAVLEERTEVKGIYLFDQFLIGGEVVYSFSDDTSETYHDLAETMPWYELGKGTKTYMIGYKDNSVISKQDSVSLIWRNSYKNTMVFAVNGDYITDECGLGILDGFYYELNDLVLYPVVNAQATVMADYPLLSNENRTTMDTLYHRSTPIFLRDLVWPDILSLTSRYNLKPTCFISTKLNYDDFSTPDKETVPFYLQQLKEIGGEAGKSLNYYGGEITAQEKYQKDEEFYHSTGLNYRFAAAFIDNIDDLDLQEKMNTVFCRDRQDHPVIGYYEDDMTLLGITADVEHFTYREDLKARSLDTALGYSGMLMEMGKVTWPSSQQEYWEKCYDRAISNVSTFWKKHLKFEQTTASESDYRVRNFLNMDYTYAVKDGKIEVDVTGVSGDVWFLLRTHGKKISKVEEGSFEKLEEGTYLIHIQENHGTIELEKSDSVWSFSK